VSEPAYVGTVHLAGGDRPGQPVRVPAQSEVLRGQVLGAGGQDGDWNTGLLVYQRRDRSITSSGHQAAAPRVAAGPLHQGAANVGRPRDLAGKSKPGQLLRQATNQVLAPARPGAPVGDDPHPFVRNIGARAGSPTAVLIACAPRRRTAGETVDTGVKP